MTRFVVSATNLLKTLQTVSGAIGTNATLPILEDFLLETSGDLLTISASDLDTSIVRSIEIQGSPGNNSVAIPSRILLDTLKTLPEQPITFAIDADLNQIELIWQNGYSKIATEPARDFPRIPEVTNEKNGFSIQSSILHNAINRTLFAVGNDDLRPAMNGVLTAINSEGIVFVATDAQKLVKFTHNEVTSAEHVQFILPKKALNLLKTALPVNEDIAVAIKYDATNAHFLFNDTHIVCRLIDARYPDYEMVIPRNNDKKLVVNRKDLQNALRRLSLFSSKSTYQVVFKISADILNLTAQDLDFSNEAHENIPCQFDGTEDISIAFNARFLLDMLNNIETEEVLFDFYSPIRAILMLPTANQPNEDLLMLVMPIIISYSS
ncbi:MAG: DNA polymerase III subunit beta [Sphingobacteriales bacterium]|jgi:DNA polymerase-3 subunit beta|nr:DNA polymerase III subunit beta [Sphingobacteriales bacterium]MBP9141098.1 DNA polymerase III subunit beta [Chitinophagales bacterium]MDA0197702.1 DNA polymerase III subunit beta [Bacteroidota bacterium]MBK7528693.1 DNA polymerase III subunit beta [Sphingobacteriales bacterium]MBL0246794.1 DNA polymerase III subunit beta [Sphingobacteriales bacterium]